MGKAEASKRINLAAPLLSVRRHGGAGAVDAAPPPSYKADATSGPLGHTGAMPFEWEHRPGHPKSVRTRRRPPPPPSPTAVPVEAATGGARTPTAAAAAREDDEAAERAQEEERFSDARDALSRDDVSSCVTVNCSATDLSDAAGAVAAAAPGARGGVMLDRFLPAAHAVAAGSPQCTFRKTASGREHPRPAAPSVARTGGGDSSPMQRRLPLQHIPTKYLPPLSPEDDDNDDAESVAHSTRGFASKRCGLLPTRCLKSTMLLLHPASGMRRRRGGGGARRGQGKPLLSDGGRGQERATNPLLRRSRNEEQLLQRHTGGHDPGMQSWEDLYVKSLLRSGRGGLTGPAAAVASELDRTVRELYRGRRGQAAVPPKASHLGLLLVLDERHGCYGSSARDPFNVDGEATLLLPPPEGPRNAGKNPRRGAAAGGEYGVPLLLEDTEGVAAAGREIVLSPQGPLLPLPLPMSPSESWLSRALPSVSSRRPPATSFLGLHLQQSRKHAPLPWCSMDPARVVDHAKRRQTRLQDLQK